MNAPSPARRVRGRFMNFSLWTSALAFFFIEGYALQDQLAIGHASIIFMLGTACLAAGASIGLFAIIAAIGFAVSAAFSEDPPPQQSHDLDQRRCHGVGASAKSTNDSWGHHRAGLRCHPRWGGF